MRRVVLDDNLTVLGQIDDGSIDFIYIDPPFHTGKRQQRTCVKTERAASGDRVGFQGHTYKTTAVSESGFADRFDDYQAFLQPRLEQARRVLKPTGSLYLHIDYREVHYCKVWLDELFGRQSFMNEIIWAYDYGGRSTRRWSAKHDSLLWYAKDPNDYTFHYDEMERIPYMAPGLVGPEKAARGKTPTDVWWHTIVSPTGKEKTGYATQKPIAILERILKVHTNPGELVLDFFAGSGTTGEAAAKLGRDFLLVDSSPQAFEVMADRLAEYTPELVRA
ncbi:MAG: site-specific DNA-methyltransferase [Planctomycetes bacterium]|jgi:site-specific DNA-methyltransferase (adenine-specific)|nr:site-specific DNA-methyltransferase [Planctomycetota bacterium]